MAIQQHPLPQDISSYRFRLIGDMTIKQFASLGICIVLAIIAYSMPLPFFFKYPLAFMFIVLGVGMAFVPVQGRSLDVWILAFIRSIYSPTQYTWKRSEETVSNEMSMKSNGVGTQAVTNARIELTQAPASVPNTPSVSITPPASEPKTEERLEITPPPSVIANPPSEGVAIQATNQTEVPVPELGKIITSLAPVIPTEPEKPTQPITLTVIPGLTRNPSGTSDAQSTPSVIARDLPAVEGARQSSLPATPSTNPPQQTQLPIPYTPTTPNTLVGLTLSPEGKILDGVMVEIQRNGLTSRATKSNKLGQFMFARPLENGLYQILAEKDSFTFSPYSLDLTGTIIRPLKIQAQ